MGGIIDIRKLRHAIALAENRSFRKAAKTVHLSQPALSRSIQSLEQELGVLLFERGAAVIRPTACGEVLLSRAKRVLLETLELERAIVLASKGELGELRLGLGPAAASLLLVPLLSALTVTYPRLRVEVDLGNGDKLLDLLLREQIQIYIGDLRVISSQESLIVEPFPEGNVGFFSRLDHPLARQSKVQIDDVAKYPIAITKFHVSVFDELTEFYGLKQQFDKLVTIRCDDFETLYRLMLNTDTVMLNTAFVFQSMMKEGFIHEIAVTPSPRVKAKFGVVRLANRTLPHAAETVMNMAHQMFQELLIRND